MKSPAAAAGIALALAILLVFGFFHFNTTTLNANALSARNLRTTSLLEVVEGVTPEADKGTSREAEEVTRAANAEDVNCDNIEEYKKGTYNKNNKVQYKGWTYESKRSKNKKPPTVSKWWKKGGKCIVIKYVDCSNSDNWKKGSSYRKNNLVQDNGVKYKLKKNIKKSNKEPANDTRLFLELGICISAQPTFLPTAQPTFLPTSAPVEAACDEFDMFAFTKQYRKNSVVTFRQKVYKSNKFSEGVQPNSKNARAINAKTGKAEWSELSSCISRSPPEESDCKSAKPWSKRERYNSGVKVKFDNKVYEAFKTNKGEKPKKTGSKGKEKTEEAETESESQAVGDKRKLEEGEEEEEEETTVTGKKAKRAKRAKRAKKSSWKLKVNCASGGKDDACNKVDNWSFIEPYVRGSKVIIGGFLWVAKEANIDSDPTRCYKWEKMKKCEEDDVDDDDYDYSYDDDDYSFDDDGEDDDYFYDDDADDDDDGENDDYSYDDDGEDDDYSYDDDADDDGEDDDYYEDVYYYYDGYDDDGDDDGDYYQEED